MTVTQFYRLVREQMQNCNKMKSYANTSDTSDLIILLYLTNF